MIQLLFLAQSCIPRSLSKPCSTITDRGTCLRSKESRLEYEGMKINGTNCVWCPGGHCTNDNEGRCEPQKYLDAKNTNNYEECLNGNI